MILDTLNKMLRNKRASDVLNIDGESANKGICEKLFLDMFGREPDVVQLSRYEYQTIRELRKMGLVSSQNKPKDVKDKLKILDNEIFDRLSKQQDADVIACSCIVDIKNLHTHTKNWQSISGLDKISPSRGDMVVMLLASIDNNEIRNGDVVLIIVATRKDIIGTEREVDFVVYNADIIDKFIEYGAYNVMASKGADIAKVIKEKHNDIMVMRNVGMDIYIEQEN